MSVTVVLGTQWGDEGKGKITDLMAKEMDLVVRYQGGNNAGHTVVIGKDTFKLHLIPSGIFYPEVLCVIGGGVVVDPKVLSEELSGLKKNGFDPAGHLIISSQAHVILPYHRLIDMAQEKKREAGRIGTTCRGIGPCYVDKFNRRGVRVGDLFNEKLLREKLLWNIEEKGFLLKEFYQMKDFSLDIDEMMAEYLALAAEIKPLVKENVPEIINEMIKDDKRVLMEGAQGTMLDVDHGTYPYVTSSNPIAGGACVGAGVGPKEIDEVLGVVKAYVTRVGEGPFPTEIEGETGEELREKGHEYGATTGRPRRCGWFDGVLLKYAVAINGLTSFVVTKLDVLSGLKTIKLCVKYECEGEEVDFFPADIYKLEKCTPIYEEFPGWDEDISKIKEYQALPENAKKYLGRLAEIAEVPIKMVSTGAERGQIIHL